MESEKQGGMETPQGKGGDFLSASSYKEQQLRHTNSIGDEGRDAGSQAGDFLRGSRADERSSALTHILQDHHHHSNREKTSTTKSNSKTSAAAAGEKSFDAVETAEGKSGDLVGDEAIGKGEKRESYSHHMPHQEVPQPGQYTDMDAVVEIVALADI